MQWFGKAIGGILGLLTAGPLGSVLGVVVGHQVDVQMALRKGRGGAHAISALFFDVAFEVMGHVAKVDGRVSENEIRVARRIMHGMRLTPEQMSDAIERFTAGKDPDYAFDERLAALGRQIGSQAELARAFVQIQLQAAIGADEFGAEKRQLLWRMASALGVGRAELAQLEALVRAHEQRGTRSASAANLDDAYRALGIRADASDEAVKTAYRRLMNRHHPDKLVARGLPASMTGVAEQKTQEVRAAYDKIKAQRGFK
jgi:DnaJ like chaperone protein